MRIAFDGVHIEYGPVALRQALQIAIQFLFEQTVFYLIALEGPLDIRGLQFCISLPAFHPANRFPGGDLSQPGLEARLVLAPKGIQVPEHPDHTLLYDVLALCTLSGISDSYGQSMPGIAIEELFLSSSIVPFAICQKAFKIQLIQLSP